MTESEIREIFGRATTRHELLFLLNRIKIEERRSDICFPFTLRQLNYFCNSSHTAEHYRVFRIPKKSGGKREICAPRKMLKSMLTCMNVLLQAIYTPSTSATGFVRGKSVVDNAKKHVGRLYVFNSDLKDFFPSISKNRVRAALMAKPICAGKELADAIANLCCAKLAFLNGEIVTPIEICFERELSTENPHKYDNVTYKDFLPQGSPASPAMTNIICRHMDWQMEHLARKYKCVYTRYADDMTFSCNRSIFSKDGDFYREFERIVQENGFTLNDKKTRVLKRGCRQEVTGLTVGEKVNVSKAYVRELTNILHIWGKYGYSDAASKYSTKHPKWPRTRNDATNICLESIIGGKLNYLKMVKGSEDPVYIRLKEKFDTLDKNPNNLLSENFIYSDIYKMPKFEKIMNCTVHFNHEKLLRVRENRYYDRYYAEMTVYGKPVKAFLGNNTIVRLMHQYDQSLTTETLNSIKNKLFISLCFNSFTKDEFWLITDYKPFRASFNNFERRLLLTDNGEIINCHEALYDGLNDSPYDGFGFDTLSDFPE